MNYTKRLAIATTFLSLFLYPRPSISSDVAVSYSFNESATEGSLVRGTMTVQVLNLGNTQLHNVLLRLAAAGPNTIESGVFQVGQIPAGEARPVAGTFLFHPDFYNSGQPILWEVDYDDSAWNRRIFIIQGLKLEQ